MKALRDNAVPSWLLTKAKPAQIRRRSPSTRRQIFSALQIAQALIEGRALSAPVLRDEFGIPWPSAKRLMHELIEAYSGRVDVFQAPRGKRPGPSVRTIRWKP